MFLYRVKYTESEYDIQDNDLLYKLDQQCQNTFQKLENRTFKKKILFFYFVICINCIIHILYCFVFVVFFVNFVIL